MERSRLVINRLSSVERGGGKYNDGVVGTHSGSVPGPGSRGTSGVLVTGGEKKVESWVRVRVTTLDRF